MNRHIITDCHTNETSLAAEISAGTRTGKRRRFRPTDADILAIISELQTGSASVQETASRRGMSRNTLVTGLLRDGFQVTLTLTPTNSDARARLDRIKTGGLQQTAGLPQTAGKDTRNGTASAT